MSPLTSVLTLAWLVLDLVFVLLNTRRGQVPGLAVVISQIVVAALVATVFLADNAMAAIGLWAMLAVVNACLATVGLANQRALATIGLAGTVGAIILIAVRSFASLPIMVIAAVFCLGAALFPPSRGTEELGS